MPRKLSPANALSRSLDTSPQDRGGRGRRAEPRAYHAGMQSGTLDLAELHRQFEADGFVKIEPLFDERRIEEIDREVARYMDEIAPGVPATDIVYESEQPAHGTRAIRNLWRMERHSSWFEALARDPTLVEIVGRLLGGEPVSDGVELFAKPAHVGSAVPFHQDNAYFNRSPPDALTCWIALDDSTLENGCVYYARGSHRQGLLAHEASNVKGNSLKAAGPPPPAALSEVPGILRRGGAILHHCVLLHRSEPNRSERPRRGLLIVYHAAHCTVDLEASRAYRKVSEAINA